MQFPQVLLLGSVDRSHVLNRPWQREPLNVLCRPSIRLSPQCLQVLLRKLGAQSFGFDERAHRRSSAKKRRDERRQNKQRANREAKMESRTHRTALPPEPIVHVSARRLCFSITLREFRYAKP